MKSLKDLKWSDLVSPTMIPEENMKNFGVKVKIVYEMYEPKSNVFEKI